ncbi:coiled-coil domain-containing protein CG32809-like isoform X3 [Actinia tenebrosa]|uniref:Coiled-coil domain-containing protein CG32809-like isoform X3 n=1 Tax=Actinia tenebrosa TaxID=6105 RepID=A0A6P8IMI1_ACTTE|nr:coiled-coil domain-containing protein CG32809-like isoform X3 [Actinia tenebrosa]
MSTSASSPQSSHSLKRSGLKGKLFGGVKVRRARSFSGQEKHKPIPVKGTKEDTATLSDTEGYSKNRRPRRRTTGGAEIADDVTRAKMSGYSSEPEDAHGGTLNRQQIIAMVKQRFGLNSTGNPARPNVTIHEEKGPPSPSSPKQIRYDRLLEQPGAYPTLPRKEDAPQPLNTPGVIYLQLGDEIRRAMIPTNLNKVDQVHSLFENTFTEKFKREHNNNRKTIYIKDPSCGIFYELEDVGDLSNKTHLKILDSAPPKPIQNGPVSKPVTSASVTYNAPSSAVHVQKQYITSTPLPNHSHVMPTDPMQNGQGSFQWKTTVTETHTVEGNPQSVTRTAVSQGSLMDKKKVPLPGLGAQLSPEKRRASKDQAVEDQLDTLTSMLQEALTKTESLDSLPVRNDSASSSQSSMAEHGPPEGNGVQHSVGILSPSYMYRSRLRSDSGAESMSDTPPTPPEVKPKPAHHLPTPPPRASSKNVSRETSIKYSQTLQRDTPKRNISQQYGTLPLPSSSATKKTVWSNNVESTPVATTRLENFSAVSRGSPVHVTYESGHVIDKSKLKSKANDLRSDIQILKAQLGQLKHIHSYQAKSFEDMMRNAKDQILLSMQKLSTAVEDSPQRKARNKVHEDEMKYIKAKNEINRTISELESEVEMVRLDVIQKRTIGNPVEVDSMNSQLALISRQIADLRSQFTEIHDSMKMVMASELDVIVQGDKFLKEEPSKLDNLVSRCKHVTGTLFTLQKLMSAQEQMKSESQISFSSLDEVDKDLIDSIRSSHLHSKPSSVQEDPRIKSNRPRVRFCDEVN